jgi:hypothetical protein
LQFWGFIGSIICVLFLFLLWQNMVAEELAANLTKADRNLGLCW